MVGGQEQGSGLCVRVEVNRSTGSVMWCVGGVNGQFEKRVQLAWALLWNELPFLVEGLDIELFVLLYFVRFLVEVP